MSGAARPSAARTLRSPVFHCPYCGEEDLRPSEEHPAGWRCSACARVFSVTLHDIDRPSGPDEERKAR